MKTIFLMVLTLVLMSCNQSRTGPSINGDPLSDFIEIIEIKVAQAPPGESDDSYFQNVDGERVYSSHGIVVNTFRAIKETTITDTTGAFVFNGYDDEDREGNPPPNTIIPGERRYLLLSEDSDPDRSLRTITIDRIIIMFVDENGEEITKFFDNIDQTFSIVVDDS